MEIVYQSHGQLGFNNKSNMATWINFKQPYLPTYQCLTLSTACITRLMSSLALLRVSARTDRDIFTQGRFQRNSKRKSKTMQGCIRLLACILLLFDFVCRRQLDSPPNTPKDFGVKFFRGPLIDTSAASQLGQCIDRTMEPQHSDSASPQRSTTPNLVVLEGLFIDFRATEKE